MMLVDMELVGEASGQIATDWESMNPQQKSLRETRQRYLWQVLEEQFFKTKWSY